jgi:hypothetical protein
MAYTTHRNLPLLPTGAVDWMALVNDLVAKLEAGRTLKLTAKVALAKGDPVFIGSDGKADKATDATACHGIWQSAATAIDAEGYAQRDGTMTFGSGWTPGNPLYVSSGSALTQAAGATPVGFALSATVIVIQPPL